MSTSTEGPKAPAPGLAASAEPDSSLEEHYPAPLDQSPAAAHPALSHAMHDLQVQLRLTFGDTNRLVNR